MLCGIVLSAIREKMEKLSSLKKNIDYLAIELRKYEQIHIENTIERNMQMIRTNNEFLMKSYEEFIAGLISESEHQIFKKGFGTRIQNSENNIIVLRNDMLRLDNDTYVKKLIGRFSEHKSISKLERCTVAKLIKSIVVNSNDDIKINFRYSHD